MHPVLNPQSPPKSNGAVTMPTVHRAQCRSGAVPAHGTQFDGIGANPNPQGMCSDLPVDLVMCSGHDQKGDMEALLRLLGVTESEAASGADIPTSVRRLHVGDTLFHEGAPAEAIYFVRAGTLKTFCTGEDGYEQVLGFSVRSDLLGLDAIGDGHYSNQTVALEESSVYVVLLRDYFSVTSRNAAIDRAVFHSVSNALRQRGELADMMAAVAAEVRLSRFLMHLSRRMMVCGQSGRRFHLRMSRRDIASYLGVAHETVSRSFSALVGLGLVSVDNREVEILDLQGLRSFSCGTRRQVDDGVRAHASRSAMLRGGATALAA